MQLVDNYLVDCKIMMGSGIELDLSAGVLQGLAFEMVLWNLLYDPDLRLREPGRGIRR